ncbi:hypothetical protein IWQ61_002154 [Dispira simplex]|nr:hypothetical protein IWQ61_002154 [Dispira simplex]
MVQSALVTKSHNWLLKVRDRSSGTVLTALDDLKKFADDNIPLLQEVEVYDEEHSGTVAMPREMLDNYDQFWEKFEEKKNKIYSMIPTMKYKPDNCRDDPSTPEFLRSNLLGKLKDKSQDGFSLIICGVEFAKLERNPETQKVIEYFAMAKKNKEIGEAWVELYEKFQKQQSPSDQSTAA